MIKIQEISFCSMPAKTINRARGRDINIERGYKASNRCLILFEGLANCDLVT